MPLVPRIMLMFPNIKRIYTLVHHQSVPIGMMGWDGLARKM